MITILRTILDSQFPSTFYSDALPPLHHIPLHTLVTLPCLCLLLTIGQISPAYTFFHIMVVGTDPTYHLIILRRVHLTPFYLLSQPACVVFEELHVVKASLTDTGSVGRLAGALRSYQGEQQDEEI